MIAKNLKVGETFVDGGLTYKVLKVNSDGTYTSTRVTGTKVEETAKTAEIIEEKTVKPVDVDAPKKSTRGRRATK